MELGIYLLSYKLGAIKRSIETKSFKKHHMMQLYIFLKYLGT